MARMPDLNSVEPGGHERLETLAASTLGRMRPDCKGARFVRDPNRVLDREPVLGYERATVVAEVSHERVAEICYDSARNQRARDVWPADRAAIRLLEYFVKSERNPDCVELLHNLCRSKVARCAQLRQTLLERFQVGKVERQHVYFALVVERAQLPPRDHANAGLVTGLTRRAHPVDSVVIRESERRQTAARRGFDYPLGR